jgi:hypothetical protein
MIYYCDSSTVAKIYLEERGYDSVQLATALHLQNTLRAFNGREVAFVGADKILNGAAKNEGLTVINPNEQA